MAIFTMNRKFLAAIALGLIFALFIMERNAFGRCKKGLNCQEALIIDFSGWRSNTDKRAKEWQETMMPEGDRISIGFKGIVPDRWRGEAGYDAIVGPPPVAISKSKYYDTAAEQVYKLIGRDKTIIHFDINEHGLPKQLRFNLPFMDKIYHPSMVAARVAGKWVKEHPNGLLILRGHSDGTYAVRYIFDYMKNQAISPDAVIIESPRQSFGDWAARAKGTPQTLFLSITSTVDPPRNFLVGKGYGNVPSDNWINLHVQGLRSPGDAHSIVSNYSNKNLQVKITDSTKSYHAKNVSLGDLVKDQIRRSIPNTEPDKLEIQREEVRQEEGEWRKRTGLPPFCPGGKCNGGGGAADPGLGGVYMDPKPTRAGKDKNDLKRNVLNSRPSRDVPSWSVEIPQEMKR